MRTNRSFLRRMVLASCFACVVIAPVNVEAGVQSDNGRATESELREQGTNERILSADNSADMQQGDIVKYPRWNVGTNLLEWIGVMPDLKYTTWASNVHGEFYFKKQYSVLLSAAYSEHHYSHGDKFQGFTSYIVEPRYWLRKDATFQGFFGGIYGQLGDYNDIDLERKYTGHFWGAGLSAGYLYPVWRGLAVEFNIRAGYRSTEVKKYVYNDAGDRCLCQRIDKNQFKLTGFALNISWRF